jgi:TldD protein
MTRRALFVLLAALCAALLAAFAVVPALQSQQSPSAANTSPSSAAASDPILSAMLAELNRSKNQLKLDNVDAPYYVEYRVSDVQQFDADAAFGALRLSQTAHARSVRVVVRVGDYKQDSYTDGQGVVDLAPIEDDPVSLRYSLWESTDRAYKIAAQALATKKANQTQFSSSQGFDDFAHADPLQSIGPLVHLQFNQQQWNDALVKATALFKTTPEFESVSANARFYAVNKYFANTEGTVTRSGYETESLSLAASAQASDGMYLRRSPSFVAAKVSDLASPDQFVDAAAQALKTLKELRAAPVVEENYAGPVLFSPDAAADLLYTMIGSNVEAVRPRQGDTARTVGPFAASYKSRVLPQFLSVVDDPTLSAFQGKSLAGSYAVDDEGVRAQKVSLIENGSLVNYLLGREPIRDFPQSNGHGRAAPGQAARPSMGNLIVQASESSSPADLRKKLIDMCRDANKPYGYYVDTLLISRQSNGRGGSTVQVEPLLLRRVYVSDGHEELVRGAAFDQLDTRSLRNDIVAAGNDAALDNYGGLLPVSVVAPSLLFDELELRQSNQKNPKLPAYDAPPLSASAAH